MLVNLFENGLKQTLISDLKWMNEPCTWSFDDRNALHISAPAMGDFFINPSGEEVKSSAPFLYTTIQGDFVMTTRVSVEMKEQYDSGCLMVMADDQNWAKLCNEFFAAKRSILSVVTKGDSDDCISGEAGTAKPYLRVARAGDCFAFHYSVDAQNWNLVRYFGMKCLSELKVGVVAQSPIGNGCEVVFEELTFSRQEQKDIRIVE
jgi:regulation of enolase protein 1 (concanavalin A-like superfamily)